MKKILLSLAGAAVALAFTSCYYDPYYGSNTTVGGTYSSGYGDGYGYGGSSFSTSVFVSTGDPRWGYDPYCYSYYDYRSRRYYDPYLNGYYPIGYRPPVVYGVPHPHGWRPGRGYCPPPSRVYNGTVRNYRDRASAYRGTSYGWAKQVRQQSASAGRPTDSRPARSAYDRRGFNQQNNGRPTDSRPSRSSYSRDSGSRYQSTRPSSRNESARPSSRYNSLVNDNQQAGRQQSSRPQASRSQPSYQQAARQQGQRNAAINQRNQAPQRQPQKAARQSGDQRQEESRIRGYR